MRFCSVSRIFGMVAGVWVPVGWVVGRIGGERGVGIRELDLLLGQTRSMLSLM